MIDSRAAGSTKRGIYPPQVPPLLQTVGRLVHIGDLPTACRLADVLIHACQPAKPCETQRRHAGHPAPESVPHRRRPAEVPLN
eukprot:357033-Chlamydomonas_euryale.AAC.11